jgi:hypothetical protein
LRTKVRIKYPSNKKRAARTGDAISYQVVVEQGEGIDKGTLGASQTPSSARVLLATDYG